MRLAAGPHSLTTLSALALFMARIAADDENHAAAAYDLTVLTNAFDAGADFHDGLPATLLRRPKAPRQSILIYAMVGQARKGPWRKISPIGPIRA